MQSAGVGPNKSVLSIEVRLLRNKQSDNVERENGMLTSWLQGAPRRDLAQ